MCLFTQSEFRDLIFMVYSGAFIQTLHCVPSHSVTLITCSAHTCMCVWLIEIYMPEQIGREGNRGEKNIFIIPQCGQAETSVLSTPYLYTFQCANPHQQDVSNPDNADLSPEKYSVLLILLLFSFLWCTVQSFLCTQLPLMCRAGLLYHCYISYI